MASIKLQRTSEYVNRLRNYQIFIDGEKTGTIANGEIKEFQTTPGQHSIIAKIDWCCSPKLTVNIDETETKNLKVGGFKNGNWIMPVGLGLVAIEYILSIFFDNEWLMLSLPVFAILVYYITIGRKKYLVLTETK